MGSYTPSMLVYWLHGHVLRSHVGTVIPGCHGGIQILENDTDLLSEYLYISDASTAAHILTSAEIPADGLFVITGTADSKSSSPSENSDPFPDSLSIIETDLTLRSLYNQVQRQVHRFLAWDNHLKERIPFNSGLQDILTEAATLIHGTILLSDESYKHLASVCDPDVREPFADELCRQGSCSPETVSRFLSDTFSLQKSGASLVKYHSSAGNNCTYVYPVYCRDQLAAYLWIILNGAEENRCSEDLGYILAEYVAEYLLRSRNPEPRENNLFTTLVGDLIEQRLTDPEELSYRLKPIRLSFHRYFHLMVISFGVEHLNHGIPWNYILTQLEYLFPYSNTATYKENIILLIRKEKRGSLLDFDESALTGLLNSYNGRAVIGNASEHLTSLPPMYHQAMDALRIGQTMHPEKRIFYYEDYSMFQMVELAANAASQHMSSQNLAHLCNNEFISLVMYDKKNGTDMTNELFVYLMNERNTVKTAQQLFIHRNTMLYKIRKIESLIGSDLDNPNLRERLVFSHYVWEYMTKYLKEDILILKRFWQPES
ncbi:MAG: helix-turn-helix domain-containing protein [Clostridiales bacterium]|nr:helix-turn-helix domain-containing protein [Clostridiales bacterium]